MDHNKAIVVLVIGIFSLLGFSMYFEGEQKAKVQVACYEAAKVNQNIKCEGSK